MMLRKVRASLWMLGITAVAVTSMAVPAAMRGAGEPVAAVRTCRVELGSVEQALAVDGALRYASEYGAISPATGVVAQVYVEPGQRVQAGEPLFRLDGRGQAAAVAALMEDGLGQLLGESQLREASAAMEALTVRAASEGVVQQVNVCQHGGVMAGSVGVLLTGGGQEIRCSVVVRDAERLHPGMEARILKDGELLTKASVGSIGPAQVSELTGQTVCQVALMPEEDISLPLGATVEAEIVLCGQANVPVLPVEAVGEGAVRWVADGRSYEIPVEVVMEDDVHCWVTLPEGVTVVQSGEATFHGQRVKEAAR